MNPLNDILWRPSPQDIRSSRLHAYRLWLKENYKIETPDYESLWEWSVDHSELFWETLISYFDVRIHSPYSNVISGGEMPDTLWFEGSTLNYAEHIFSGMAGQKTAILFTS